MNIPDHPLWRGVFAGPAALYGAAARLRSRLYAGGFLETVRWPMPVFCVGNLTVGGSGKTPVTLWLAERLKAAGRRPAVLSRGYGRRDRTPVFVPNQGDPLPGVDRLGDEPRLLASRLPGVPLSIDADRAAAAGRAWASGLADCAVMDDGFQHRRLYRERDLLCLDARTAHAVFAGGRPTPWLPAGPWREKPAAGVRAAGWVFTRAERLSGAEKSALGAAGRPGGAPAFFAAYTLSFYDGPTGRPLPAGELAGRGVLALSGVADPGGFEAALTKSGARVRSARFADHHLFTEGERARVADDARRAGLRVVTTEKDWQRLPPDFPAVVARLDLRWEGEDPWASAIESAFH